MVRQPDLGGAKKIRLPIERNIDPREAHTRLWGRMNDANETLLDLSNELDRLKRTGTFEDRKRIGELGGLHEKLNDAFNAALTVIRMTEAHPLAETLLNETASLATLLNKVKIALGQAHIPGADSRIAPPRGHDRKDA